MRLISTILILITLLSCNKQDDLCTEQVLDVHLEVDSDGALYTPNRYTVVTYVSTGGTNYYYGITRLYQYGECYP